MTFSQKTSSPEAVLLMDNGSLRPEATLGLRRVAAALEDKLGLPVHPVSVLHSHKVAPSLLGGKPAVIFDEAIPALLNAGLRHLSVLPFFFGPSRALTEYLPSRFADLGKTHPGARLSLAPPLAGSVHAPDPRLAKALKARLNEIDDRLGHAASPVVVVDHGSPVPDVARVRDRVGGQLQALLGSQRRVAVSSMERRPGPDYAFNDPLLARVLQEAPFSQGNVIIAQLFLLEGRHAGDDGDIATICRQAEEASPRLHCHRTRLLGEHPLLLDILQDRFRDKPTQIITIDGSI